MFATPITDEETKITTVENNGHAMAPYMMSVGLWVGCLAFCLMYPLTEHKGKLKSGFAWWASKASVLYPVAILQGVLLILLLHRYREEVSSGCIKMPQKFTAGPLMWVQMQLMAI